MLLKADGAFVAGERRKKSCAPGEDVNQCADKKNSAGNNPRPVRGIRFTVATEQTSEQPCEQNAADPLTNDDFSARVWTYEPCNRTDDKSRTQNCCNRVSDHLSAKLQPAHGLHFELDSEISHSVGLEFRLQAKWPSFPMPSDVQ